jgi:hypothetical protein
LGGFNVSPPHIHKTEEELAVTQTASISGDFAHNHVLFFSLSPSPLVVGDDVLFY